MPQKSMLYSLIVICLTILLFTWMVRDSLCELHIKQGNNELAASLACNIRQSGRTAGNIPRRYCGVMQAQCTLFYLTK